MKHFEGIQGGFLNARKQAEIVREVQRLQNIRGGKDITISQTPSGIVIARHSIPLLIDDKCQLDMLFNSSTRVQRVCDRKEGELDDIWRVRATPHNFGDKLDPYHQLMWLINFLTSPKGGWLTTAAHTGLGLRAHDGTPQVATPLRCVSQIGDVLLLPTDDDLISMTEDNDRYVLTNINWFAHFHMTPALDGAIHFVTDPPPPTVILYGAQPWVKGDMRCDPDAIIIPSPIGRESGRWRPCVPQMVIFGPMEERPDPDTVIPDTVWVDTVTSPGAAAYSNGVNWIDLPWGIGGGVTYSGYKLLAQQKAPLDDPAKTEYVAPFMSWVCCEGIHEKDGITGAAKYVAEPAAQRAVFELYDGQVVNWGGVNGVLPDIYWVNGYYAGKPDTVDCSTWIANKYGEQWWNKTKMPAPGWEYFVYTYGAAAAATKTWSVDHYKAVGYVAGGATPPLGQPTTKVYFLDPEDPEGHYWQDTTPLPLALYPLVGGVVKNTTTGTEHFVVCGMHGGFIRCFVLVDTTWIETTNSPAEAALRYHSAGFSLAGKFYLVSGSDENGANFTDAVSRLYWRPAPNSDWYWETCAALPVEGREYATAFANEEEGAGYFGLGKNTQGGHHTSFYRFVVDEEAEGFGRWFKAADFAGKARASAAGVSTHVYSGEGVIDEVKSFVIGGDFINIVVFATPLGNTYTAWGDRFEDVWMLEMSYLHKIL